MQVNGADVWSRGANQIPMEELEGRQDAAAYAAMLASAAAANHNMLRVWGGGIFLPSVFYDTADALGIMLYHDAMYGAYPRPQPHTDGAAAPPLRLYHPSTGRDALVRRRGRAADQHDYAGGGDRALDPPPCLPPVHRPLGRRQRGPRPLGRDDRGL